MHSHIRSGFILAAAATSLMSSAALAQTSQPKAGAETSSVTAVTVSTTKWMTQETADQWRASKLIGLNVYNDSSEKIGDISELIVDRDGKLEAVVVGVGGFLGLGEHDVAIPYSQISWVDRPVTASSTSTIGPLPKELQVPLPYSAVLSAHPLDEVASKAFLQALASTPRCATKSRARASPKATSYFSTHC